MRRVECRQRAVALSLAGRHRRGWHRWWRVQTLRGGFHRSRVESATGFRRPSIAGSNSEGCRLP